MKSNSTHRITITLPEEMHGHLKTISRITGNAQSNVLLELLVTAQADIKAVATYLGVVEKAQGHYRAGLRDILQAGIRNNKITESP